MLVVDRPRDLKNYVGKELGVSDWLLVDQERINLFADATGDHQWIHVDVERARREMEIGNTIAHGYLTLSLIPMLISQVYTITQKTRGINYGLNRVRFTAMVPAGSRIRLRQHCKSVEDVEPDGIRMISECVIERQNSDRPVCIAEIITLAYA